MEDIGSMSSDFVSTSTNKGSCTSTLGVHLTFGVHGTSKDQTHQTRHRIPLLRVAHRGGLVLGVCLSGGGTRRVLRSATGGKSCGRSFVPSHLRISVFQRVTGQPYICGRQDTQFRSCVCETGLRCVYSMFF